MKLLLARFVIPLMMTIGSTVVYAQNVFIGGGNSWDVNANWQDIDADLIGDIGDVITENVTLSPGTSALVNNGFNYTIGDLSIANGSTLSVNSTGTLNIGQSGTPKNLTANNNATINVSGTLIIWGDLTVNTNLTWNITGTVIIKGNVLMNDGATMFATGNLTISGNFTGGDNTNFTILGGGHAEVYGVVTVGMNSHFTGPPGSFHAHGCSQGSGSDYCTGGILPIELISFRANTSSHNISLSWATASELNVDYFVVEKSNDGKVYTEVGQVRAAGNSKTRNDYSLVDEKPSLGRVYYRLTEVDNDRVVTHAMVIAVNFTHEKVASVYPNPVTDGQLSIDLNFVPETDAIISIVDLRGVTLTEFSLSQQNITVPIQVSPGSYLVMVRSRDFKSMSRLVVK